MNRFANDLLGRLFGDRFNLHSAFGARDYQRRGGGAVEQNREINLA
jgi:hypothetical protein